MQIFLKEPSGKIVRTFQLTSRADLVWREDLARIEIHSNRENLERRKIPYRFIYSIVPGEFDYLDLPMGMRLERESLGGVDFPIDGVNKNPHSRASYLILFLILLINGSLFLYNFLQEEEYVADEEESQVVRIVRRPEIPPTTEKKVVRDRVAEVETEPKEVTRSVSRMGALQSLGESAPTDGGLNLEQVQTSPGAGLGGLEGSGGVQRSHYAQGLVRAPVGETGTVAGQGGYGTVGRGGGQEGHGRLEMTGSAGGHPIPLGREAIFSDQVDQALIAEIIQRNIGQVRFCYEQGLQSDPGLRGRVAVAFSIGSEGQVLRAAIDSTSLHSQLVEDCIVMRLRTWRFPVQTTGGEIHITYPFQLRRAGQG